MLVVQVEIRQHDELPFEVLLPHRTGGADREQALPRGGWYLQDVRLQACARFDRGEARVPSRGADAAAVSSFPSLPRQGTTTGT